jgi:hypothetical protein
VQVGAFVNASAMKTHDLLWNAMMQDVYLMNEMQLTVTTSVMKQNHVKVKVYVTKTKWNVKMKIVSPTNGRSLSANEFRDALTHVNSRRTLHRFLQATKFVQW